MLSFGRQFLQKTGKSASLLSVTKHAPISVSACRQLQTSQPIERKHGIIYPLGFSFDWAYRAAIPNIDKYTHEPLPYVRTGGRGPDGRVALKHISGGLQRPFFMVDWHRGGANNGPEQPAVVEEKVLMVHCTWWRSEFIALVARGMHKRWVGATHCMRPGQIIRSHGLQAANRLIANPVSGDAYPLWSLPVGTVICQVEQSPGQGAHYCCKAGTMGTVMQKTPAAAMASVTDKKGGTTTAAPLASVVIKLSGKNRRLVRLSGSCAAVVGQMSNPDHNKHKFKTFGEKTWHGIKQRSGWRQRKTGRFGRRVRPQREPLGFLLESERLHNEMVQMRYTGTDLPTGNRKRGTRENPRGIHRYSVRPGDTHPRFRYCTWSSVR